MDAWASHSAGAALVPFQYEPEPLGPHDCEIRISHCGLCHSDLHLLDDDWRATRRPLVPGHEVVGTVTAAGSESAVAVGARVGVGWQRSACLDCAECHAGDEHLCRFQQATCVGHHGGFAGGIRVDSRFAFEIPAALDDAHAAPLLCGGITVFSPLRRYGVGAGARVAVIGIGGLGHLALQFARALGAEVTALSSSADKADEARAFGAHAFVHTADPKSLATYRRRFDLVLSTVTADLDWSAYLATVAPRGTLCFVGYPPSRIALSAGALIGQERSVSGSSTGSRARIVEMLAFAAGRGVRPQVELLPMADVNVAVGRLRANRARYRIVLAA